MSERRIAVIGGGLAGLAAGHALARRGVRVELYEALERAGGRAMSDELDGVRVDPGAQLFGSMYVGFLELVRDLGLGDRLVRVPGRDALWRNGRPHEVVYGSAASMAASGGLAFRTKMRLASRYVPFLARHASALDLHAPEAAARAGLDRESIAAWGEREMDTAFVDSLVYPQLGAYYGVTPEETSAGFYHILAHHGLDVVLYAVDGGIGQVAERAVQRIRESGGEVRLGCRVDGIHVADGRASVSGGFGAERYDAVVSALPAPVLREALSGAPESLTRWLAAVRYRPTLSLALVIERPLDRRFFGLSFPRGETRYLAAVAIQERKGVPLSQPERGALVAFPTPETAESLIELESREILDRMLPEILIALPEVEQRISRARVHRWPVGSPVIFPGYLERLGRFRADGVEGHGPVVVAGDYLYGASAEAAVVSGLRAVARLERRTGGF